MRSVALILLLLTAACHQPAAEPAVATSAGDEAEGAPAADPTLEGPPEEASRGCVRAGCGGQLCVPEGDEPMTTCEERPEYACYREARCEAQADGSCGFTRTPELERCLARP